MEAMQNNDFLKTTFWIYPRIENSWIKAELWKTRNYRQGFEKAISTALSTLDCKC